MVVYGHKSPLMLVSFFAAVKAGAALRPSISPIPLIALRTFSRANRAPAGYRWLTSRSLPMPPLPNGCWERRSADGLHVGETVSRIVGCRVTTSSTFVHLGQHWSSQGRADALALRRCVHGLQGSCFPAGPDRISFNRVPLHVRCKPVRYRSGALGRLHAVRFLTRNASRACMRVFRALAASGDHLGVDALLYRDVPGRPPRSTLQPLPRLDTIVLCGEVVSQCGRKQAARPIPRRAHLQHLVVRRKPRR